MDAYINPQVFIPSNPIGIDAEFAKIQELIYNSAVIEKVFGRAYLQKDVIKSQDKGSDSVYDTDYFYPCCYLNNDEPITLMPNDNVISQSFFYLREQEELKDEGVLQQVVFSTARTSLIVWGNFRLMNISSPEFVKLKMIEILKSYPSIVVVRIYEAFDTVFDKFTINDNLINYNKFPYFAIRIDFDLSYDISPENC